MRIQHNIAAMNAYRNFSNNTSALSKNLEKLSSGYKINRAGDDAAGLAISEKMRAQITGLKTAQANAKSGINLVQTAEGAMTEVHDMLNRMYELANQSANGTYDDATDRANLQKEVSQLKSEIDRIADSTNFNGIKLMDGSLGEKAIDAYDKAMGSVNLVDGVTVNAPVDGAGKKDQFTLAFSGTFGKGDSMTLKVATTDANGVTTTKDLDLTYDARIKDTPTAGKFSGETKLEQMTSIAGALGEDADLAANYDVEVIDTSTGKAADANSADENITVRLTAKNEGVSNTKLTVTNGENNISDAQVVVNASTTTAGANAVTADSGATTNAGGYKELLNKDATAAGKLDISAGDTLKFNVTVQGKDMTVTLKVGDKDASGKLVKGTGDFVIGSDNEETMTNLANALQDASFDDNGATAIDESQFKVSEYFTVTANKATTVADATEVGSLKITATTGAGIAANSNAFGALDVTFAGGATKQVGAVAPSGAASATASTDKTKKVYTAKTEPNSTVVTDVDFSKLDQKLTGTQVSLIKGLSFTDAASVTDFSFSFADLDLKAGDTVETALEKMTEAAKKAAMTYNANKEATGASYEAVNVDAINIRATDSGSNKAKITLDFETIPKNKIVATDLSTGSTVGLAGVDFKNDTTKLTQAQIDALKGLGNQSLGQSTELKINFGTIGIEAGDTGASALEKIRQALNDAVMSHNATESSGATTTGTYNRYDLLNIEVDPDVSNKLVITGGYEEISHTEGNSDNAAALQEVTSIGVSDALMKGDTVTLRGKLSDGLEFQVDLEAGKDFQVGANHAETMKNLANALNNGDATVKVTGPDGKVKAFTSDKIFNENEFKAEADAGRGIVLTSMGAGAVGKGVAAGITSAQVTVAERNKPSNVTVTQDVVGKAQSKAENTITFDPEKIEQGTTMSIDGKTYEFVTSADMLTNENNIAVIVDSLGDRGEDGKLTADAATGEDIAKALIQAMHNDSTTPAGTNPATNAFEGKYTTTLKDADGNDSTVTFTMSVDPNSNTLKMVSDTSGTGAVALKDIAVSSDKQDSAVVTFGTTTTGLGSNAQTSLNVKVGDTITIDGTTYEFTDGEHRTKEEGNIGISLKGIGTANQAAQALADAVNANTKAGMAAGKTGGVIATVDKQTGSVVLTSKYTDTKGEGHEYDAPTVQIPEGGNGLTLQIGDTSEVFNKLTVSIGDMHADALGIGDVDVSTQESADAAISKIKDAINSVSSTRGTLGATQNRLDHTINNLSVMQENIQDAESSIRDTDVAAEMMEYTKNNILIQSAQAMLAQANQLPQGVLQLLQ